MVDIGDVHIASHTFDQVVSVLGSPPLSFDCFAAQHNTKCKLFATRWLDAHCQFSDAFSHGIHLKNHKCWIFPPFNIILQTIQWIIRYNITGILLVPITKGASWWPMLSSLNTVARLDVPVSCLITGARLPKGYTLSNMSHLRALRIEKKR